MEQIEFEVTGGMCRLQFKPGSSCGRDPNDNPGISFTLIGDSPAFHRDGKYYMGMGVFGRDDAQLLADMIYRFLETNPPVVSNENPSKEPTP